MEAYFMGIDTGTQGVRIGISDTRGKLIFEKEQKWETEFPKVGWAEQNPLNWWEAVNGILNSLHTHWILRSDRISEPVAYVLPLPLLFR